jgi:hypothetical protein
VLESIAVFLRVYFFHFIQVAVHLTSLTLILLFSPLLGFGLTETPTHILPVQDWLRKVGSIGVLLPNLEARLVRDDTNSADGKNAEDVKPGEPGELWIRGPSVMKVIYCISVMSTSFSFGGWWYFYLEMRWVIGSSDGNYAIGIPK